MRKRFKDNHPIINEKGYTLVIVLMVLVVMSVLGIGLMTTTANTMKLADSERIDQATYYIAEAGLVQKREELNRKIDEAFKTINETYKALPNKEKAKYKFKEHFYAEAEKNIAEATKNDVFEDYEVHFGKKPKSTITLTQDKSDSNKYLIESLGEIGNQSRKVSQEFTVLLNVTVSEVSETYVPEYALHVIDNIIMSGNINITGSDIATESPEPYVVVPNNLIVDKDKPITAILPLFPEENYNILERLEPSDSKISTCKNNKSELIFLDNDMKLNTLENKCNLTIDVGDTDKKLLINNLNIMNGNIILKGRGKLEMYVKNNISINGDVNINTPQDTSKLMVYYKGSQGLTMSGSHNIFGSLYAQSADITISGNSGFQGNIYTGGKNVTISGRTNANKQLFFTPNAHVTLSGNTDLTGAIIAKSFTASGNISIEYAPTDPIPTETIFNYDNVNSLSIQSALIEERKK